MRDTMEKLDKSAKKIIDKIKSQNDNNPEIIFREITLFDTKIYILNDEMVSDKTYVDEYVLDYLSKERINGNSEDKEIPKDLLTYFEETIPVHKITRIKSYEDLYLNLFSGFSIFIIDGYDEVLTLETRAKLDSGVQEAKNELVLKGPKDAFTENYQTNVGLIRKRIRSTNLKLKEKNIK
jgi:hypothetical protein